MDKEDRIPRIIYLQWGDWADSRDDGITWCVDRINDDDIEYRLAVLPGPEVAHIDLEDLSGWGKNDLIRQIEYYEKRIEHYRNLLE